MKPTLSVIFINNASIYQQCKQFKAIKMGNTNANRILRFPINKSPQKKIKNMKTTNDWHELNKRLRKTEYSLIMYEKYIKLIMENWDKDTVFKHLEERGVDADLKWAIHKLLFLYNSDMTPCLLECIDAKKDLEIKHYTFT